MSVVGERQMSYTMTIEAPEKAAWFEQRRLKVSPRVHALRGVVHLPEDFDEREFKRERLSHGLVQ